MKQHFQKLYLEGDANSRPTWLNEFVITLINKIAYRLCNHPAMQSWEEEDIAQELFLKLHDNFRHYDSQQGHSYPFIVAMLERHAGTLIRNAKAQMRDETRITNQVSQEELEQSQLSSSSYSEQRWHDARDLAVEASMLLAQLPEKYRELAECLKGRSVAETARDLGKARSTIYRWVRELRQYFEDDGLRIYLE